MPQPLQFLTAFGLNLMMTLIIVRLIYFPSDRKSKHVVTFIAFNSMIFFLMTVLTTAELSLGTGLGLFALFSLLRYRSRTMSPRDITYLFVLVVLPVVNSVPLVTGGDFGTLMIGNGLTIGLLFALERGWGFGGARGPKERSQRVTIQHGELLRPENYGRLLEEMRQRTGLPVKRIALGKLNLVSNTAEITLFYDDLLLGAGDNGDGNDFVDEGEED